MLLHKFKKVLFCFNKIWLKICMFISKRLQRPATYTFSWLCVRVCVCMFRNQPALPKITSCLVWSWKRWTERTLTWFVPPQLERSEVRRSSSCLTAGEVPLTIGAPSTPETSSPSAGVLWQNTACSPREISVSAALIVMFYCRIVLTMRFNNNGFMNLHWYHIFPLEVLLSP